MKHVSNYTYKNLYSVLDLKEINELQKKKKITLQEKKHTHGEDL